MSRAWVDRLKQRRRETGQVTPGVQTVFRRSALTAEQEHRLGPLLLVQPDATLAELQAALPTTAALSTLWRAVGRYRLTLKKTVYAEEQRRPDVAAARRRWWATQALQDMRAQPAVRAAIERVGATVRYLPPYSPTSIRSSKPSRSSRLSCARHGRAVSTTCAR